MWVIWEKGGATYGEYVPEDAIGTRERSDEREEASAPDTVSPEVECLDARVSAGEGAREVCGALLGEAVVAEGERAHEAEGSGCESGPSRDLGGAHLMRRRRLARETWPRLV